MSVTPPFSSRGLLWTDAFTQAGLSFGGAGLVPKSCRTFVTPRTSACQGPLPMGFSRQEYCSGLLFPSPGDLPDPGIESRSSALQADPLPTELRGNTQPFMFNKIPSG